MDARVTWFALGAAAGAMAPWLAVVAVLAFRDTKRPRAVVVRVPDVEEDAERGGPDVNPLFAYDDPDPEVWTEDPDDEGPSTLGRGKWHVTAEGISHELDRNPFLTEAVKKAFRPGEPVVYGAAVDDRHVHLLASPDGRTSVCGRDLYPLPVGAGQWPPCAECGMAT